MYQKILFRIVFYEVIYLNSTGYLLVNARTALGALPVSGARVTVNGAAEPIEVYTDMSGATERIELLTPDVENSLSPGSVLPPYSSYNVSVEADGFYTVRTKSVPVFPGVTSVQNVNMIPVSGYGAREVPSSEINFDESGTYPVEEGR